MSGLCGKNKAGNKGSNKTGGGGGGAQIKCWFPAFTLLPIMLSRSCLYLTVIETNYCVIKWLDKLFTY